MQEMEVEGEGGLEVLNHLKSVPTRKVMAIRAGAYHSQLLGLVLPSA